MNRVANFEELVLAMNANDEEVFINLQDANLLPSNRYCQRNCTLVRKDGQKLNRIFRCPRCRKTFSIIQGTFLKIIMFL